MWEEAEAMWSGIGLVEYGIYQIDAVMQTPIWRRHVGSSQTRFRSVRSGLFGKQGARNACRGMAPYPKARYASGDELFVPYAATWLQGSRVAYLVRASAREPEVTLVESGLIGRFGPSSEQQALTELAGMFARGAEEHGVRWLRPNRLETP
jgi:hypothetical protein